MERTYSFDEVIAFAIIGLNDLINSANRDNITLEQFGRFFMEPLEKTYRNLDVIECANKLKNV